MASKLRRRKLEEIRMSNDSWLTLNDLRELVAEADRLGWVGSSLVCHDEGETHPYRSDVRITRAITIEGGGTGG